MSLLRLVPTRLTMLSIQSILFCCPFWLTKDIIKLLLSKKRSSSSRSNSVIFSHCKKGFSWRSNKSRFFLESIQILETKILSPKKCPIAPTNCKLWRVPGMTRFTVNFTTVMFLKQNSMTWLRYLNVERPQKMPFGNRNYESKNPRESKIISISMEIERRTNELIQRLLALL